jgi:hypothetical protein
MLLVVSEIKKAPSFAPEERSTVCIGSRFGALQRAFGVLM